MMWDLGRRMDIAASTADMKWTCVYPGFWQGHNGVNSATAERDGGVWEIRFNGTYMTDVDTLAHARAYVAENLRTLSRQWRSELK